MLILSRIVFVLILVRSENLSSVADDDNDDDDDDNLIDEKPINANHVLKFKQAVHFFRWNFVLKS